MSKRTIGYQPTPGMLKKIEQYMTDKKIKTYKATLDQMINVALEAEEKILGLQRTIQTHEKFIQRLTEERKNDQAN